MSRYDNGNRVVFFLKGPCWGKGLIPGCGQERHNKISLEHLVSKCAIEDNQDCGERSHRTT